jgi:hypothetical protein
MSGHTETLMVNLVMEKLEKHAMNRVTAVDSLTIMHVVHFVVIL